MARKPKGKQVRDADGRVVAVRGKAANGEGSVYAVDGGTRWRATWREAGRLRSVSGTTREKVLIRRAERMAAGPRVKGRLTDTSTVAELAAWWLDTVARHRVRPSTLPKYEDHLRRLGDMGDLPVGGLTPEHVATWQAGQLASGLAPKTVANARAILRQVLAQGVELGVLGTNPVDRVKPPKPQRTDAAALTPAEARRLIAAAAPDRLGAAVALLFVQGWRVSEVLGLAWTDLDLEAGTATIRRAAVYVDGVGATLGPPKTEGAHGRHHLAPGVVQALAERRRRQQIEQANAGGAWRTVVYGDAPVALVFTQHDGSIVLRQAVTKVIKKAAVAAGIDPALVSTHTGRRTVVTALYASEGVDLADIARHVGHSRTATTEGYVRQLGQRPKHTAEAAARALDAVG